MSAYLDKIMSNHVFNSESSEDLSYLYSDENKTKSDNISHNSLRGGNDESNKKASGGFPPIVIINNKTKLDDEKDKSRGLTSVKTAISIMDILKKKKTNQSQ